MGQLYSIHLCIDVRLFNLLDIRTTNLSILPDNNTGNWTRCILVKRCWVLSVASGIRNLHEQLLVLLCVPGLEPTDSQLNRYWHHRHTIVFHPSARMVRSTIHVLFAMAQQPRYFRRDFRWFEIYYDRLRWGWRVKTKWMNLESKW